MRERVQPHGFTANAYYVRTSVGHINISYRRIVLAAESAYQALAAMPRSAPLTRLSWKCGITSSAINRIDLNHGAGSSA